MMNEILNENHVPKKLNRINSKILKPAYRLVASVNFLIGTSAIVILLALMLIGSKVTFV